MTCDLRFLHSCVTSATMTCRSGSTTSGWNLTEEEIQTRPTHFEFAAWEFLEGMIHFLKPDEAQEGLEPVDLGLPLLRLEVVARHLECLLGTPGRHGFCCRQHGQTSQFSSTVLVLRMAHRKWKETKQQHVAWPSCAWLLLSFQILWAILSTSTVHASASPGLGRIGNQVSADPEDPAN